MLKVIQVAKAYPKDATIVAQLCTMLEIKETNPTRIVVREEILSIFPTILAEC